LLLSKHLSNLSCSEIYLSRPARHESEAAPSALARAPRPLWRGHPFAPLRAGSARALLRLIWGCGGPLFKGGLSFLQAGAGRSRHSGRDARATTYSPESRRKPKALHFCVPPPPTARRLTSDTSLARVA
jgi:hypothetical protein